MKNLQGLTEARSAADQMVAHRFNTVYGVTDLGSYLDRIDQISTAHLSHHLRHTTLSVAGKQRRNVNIYFDPNDPKSLLVGVSMSDPRKLGAEVTAVLEFRVWLDLLEMGAHGVWYFNTKGRLRGGQVVVKPPLRRSVLVGSVAIARLITNAKAGQQAKTDDRNPLNLRRTNLHLVGNPESAGVRVGTAKADARAEVISGKSLQTSLAGCNYGIPNAPGE